MFDNIMTMADGYKHSHWAMLPPGMTGNYAYMESRGGRFPEITFFGLQYILRRYLAGSVVTDFLINRAARRMAGYIMGGSAFNELGWRHIFRDHEGKLPLQIKAIPEGMTVPVHTPILTVENTCPECAWLPSFVETVIEQVWYPTTVCTVSREAAKIIKRHLEISGTPDTLRSRLHGFGMRGVSSMESSAIGDAGHLVNFSGTDTMTAMDLIEKYYGELDPARSINAGEHSAILAWGRDRELDAFQNALNTFPDALLAMPVDTYDDQACIHGILGHELYQRLMARKGGFIFRLDSGDPVESVRNGLETASDVFQTTQNAKGYAVLPDGIRGLQGDGVDLDSIDKIYTAIEQDGYSADNISFGMGGALLQKVDRDTQKFAYKTSWVMVHGQGYGVAKTPKGDPSKASKEGRFSVVQMGDGIYTVPEGQVGRWGTDLLETVFLNGQVMKNHHFFAIRLRAAL